MNDNNSPAETARQNDNGNNPENRPGPAADTSESKAETTTNTAADSNNESHSGNTSKPGERPDRRMAAASISERAVTNSK